MQLSQVHVHKDGAGLWRSDLLKYLHRDFLAETVRTHGDLVAGIDEHPEVWGRGEPRGYGMAIDGGKRDRLGPRAKEVPLLSPTKLDLSRTGPVAMRSYKA